MKKPLRALIVEDDPADYTLTLRALNRGQFEVTAKRVWTAAGLREALQEGGWDVVLSDYSLPEFSGPEALGVLRERVSDTPFIAISGTIEEEQAIPLIKAGAADFITKQHLSRLVTAIERELRNVEQRRALAATERAKRATEMSFYGVLEQCPLPTVILDRHHRVEYVNPSHEQTFGIGAAQARAHPEATGFLVDDFTRPFFASAFAGSPAIAPARPYAVAWGPREGREFMLQLFIYPVHGPDERVERVVCMSQDLTELKRSEESLIQRTEELSRSNADLEQYAYIAAHDLQEPLRMISSYLQLIERRLADALDGNTRRYLDYVTASAQRMQRMILAVLEFSLIGRDRQPRAAVVDLDQAVAQAATALAAEIRDRGAQLEIEPLAPVLGDQGHLGRLLQNLLSNALKFARDGEPPRIRVRSRAEDGEIHLTIEDNGIGIPPGEGGRLFGMFQRLHRDDRYPGTGMGLATCKRIVDHHGGRIWFTPAEPHGTVFHVALPAARR